MKRRFGSHIHIKTWIMHVFVLLVFTAYIYMTKVRIQVDRRNNALILGLLCGYIFWAYIKGYINRNRLALMVIAIFTVAMSYQFFTQPINTPYPLLSYIILLSCNYFPYAVYMVLLKRDNPIEMKIVFWGITCIIAYVYINTLREYGNNKSIVHALTKVNYLNYTDDIQNTATIDTSYAIIPLICFLMYCINNTDKKLFKMILIVIGIILSYVAVTAQYTTVFLILAIVLAYELTKGAKKKLSKYVWIMVGVMIIFLLPALIDIFATNVQSINMQVRLTEVSNALRYGDISGYNLSSRLNLYFDGVKAFLHSPIWGNALLEFNPHSSFIQVAADTGIIGLYPYIYLIYKSYKIVESTLSEYQKVIFRSAYISLIITGMVNPIISMYAFYFVVFLYVPLGMKVYSRKGL